MADGSPQAEDGAVPGRGKPVYRGGWLPAVLFAIVVVINVYGGLRGSDAPVLDRPLFTDGTRLTTVVLFSICTILFTVNYVRGGRRST